MNFQEICSIFTPQMRISLILGRVKCVEPRKIKEFIIVRYVESFCFIRFFLVLFNFFFRCIVKLDHHSLFLGKCVGKNNYKYFMSYTIYSFINSLFLIIFSLGDLWKILSFDLKAISLNFSKIH